MLANNKYKGQLPMPHKLFQSNASSIKEYNTLDNHNFPLKLNIIENENEDLGMMYSGGIYP